MHEVGLMMQAIELAESLTRQRGGREIQRLVLRVGRFSGVDVEALRLAFEAASPETMAAQALLEIDEVAAVCRCAECHSDFHPDPAVFACPKCGTISTDVTVGSELDLTTLEFI